jgi:hypothetical protein
MLVVREIMYCKPGKVRPLVQKFLEMNTVAQKVGMPKMTVMTDFCAERYWTVVSEMQVESLQAFEQMMQGGPAGQGQTEAMKEMEKIMKDYHDFVEYGRREVYKIEG